MTPNLIPERRIDKNGNAVIRHVLAQMDAASGRSIPAPAPVSSVTELLISRVIEVLPEYGRTENTITSLRTISHYSPELLTEIAENYLKGTKDERGVWRNAFSGEKSVDEVNEKFYRRMIEIVPLTVLLTPDAPPGFRLGKALECALSAESLTGVEPGTPEYVQAKAWFIIRIVEQIKPTGEDIFYARRDDWSFITSNLESVIPLIPELLKRRTASEGVIRELLSNEASSLNDGVL